MSSGHEVEVPIYHAPGVTTIIASSFYFFLGLIDEETVVKYPHSAVPAEDVKRRLDIEAKMYSILGKHDGIIDFKGFDGHGISLEFAVNGSVAQYLKKSDFRPTAVQRLMWATQAADAMAHIHRSSILHCDINLNNLLLDKDLIIKFADFQGRYLSSEGDIILDGLSSENVKSYMPRSNIRYADQKTDIFALGSAIYGMVTGHEPFPDLDSFDDSDEAEIVARYKSGRFPVLDSCLGGDVIYKCWTGMYGSASELADDLRGLIKDEHGLTYPKPKSVYYVE